METIHERPDRLNPNAASEGRTRLYDSLSQSKLAA